MAEACGCRFDGKEHKKQQQREIISDPDLELPPFAIENAVRDEVQDNWVTKCSCEDRSNIISAVHYEHNDWYLCTIKNMITKSQFRGRGFASMLSDELMKNIKNDDRCVILAADVDSNNLKSLGIWKNRHGFRQVSRFCWGEGEEPVDVLHFVQFPPDMDKCVRS